MFTWEKFNILPESRVLEPKFMEGKNFKPLRKSFLKQNPFDKERSFRMIRLEASSKVGGNLNKLRFPVVKENMRNKSLSRIPTLRANRNLTVQGTVFHKSEKIQRKRLFGDILKTGDDQIETKNASELSTPKAQLNSFSSKKDKYFSLTPSPAKPINNFIVQDHFESSIRLYRRIRQHESRNARVVHGISASITHKTQSTSPRSSLYTWSDSYFTLLGHNTQQPIYAPCKVDLCYKPYEITPKKESMELAQMRTSKDLTFKFSTISTGPYHALFVTDQGTVMGVGESKYRKKGHDSPTRLLDRVSGLSGIIIKEVACGLDHSLALSNIGEVYSWGFGGIGEKFIKSLFVKDPASPLGHNTFENLEVPCKIEGLENVKQVEAGYHHSLALTCKTHLDTGDLFVFGDNFYGQLGISESLALKPKALTLTNVQKISAARDYSVALTHAGEVFVWGFNHYGQLGLDAEIVKQPTLVATGCVNIEAGEGLVVLVFDECVKIAGLNKFFKFTRVETQSRPIQMVAGDTFVAYVDRFGEVWHIGGLFGESRSFFYMKTPELEFQRVENGFFPGKVKKLFGKYSYHAAILED